MRVAPSPTSPLLILFASAMTLLLCLAASPACAQAYKWVDDEGGIHFTDNPTDVPLQYRERLEKRDLPPPAPRTASSARAGGGGDDALREKLMAQLRAQPGDISPEKQRQVADLVLGQFWWLVIGGLLNGVVSLLMFGHALVKHRWLWAIANFFIGLTTPIYACSQLESPVPARLTLVAIWLAGPITSVMLYLDIIRVLAS